MGTAIEWTDETWNPVTGCTKVSPGCDHCYAERITERFHGKGSFDRVVLHSDRILQPLRWRKPRNVFVNSMSDLFHDDVPEKFIQRVFAAMEVSTQHTFQILTKRPGRMASIMNRWAAEWADADNVPTTSHVPLRNVWLGTSVEDQRWADIRIPKLLETPSAMRFLSCEPLLGAVDLASYIGNRTSTADVAGGRLGIDWVIVGGESGPGARPMHPDWPRSLRAQCVGAGVPFFFKQWGGPTPKSGGRKLDGRTWDEMPTGAAQAEALSREAMALRNPAPAGTPSRSSAS
jgi:protein gp37